MPRRAALPVGVVTLLCGCLACLGPVSADELRQDERELLRQLEQRGLSAEEIVRPHALSDEMKRWLADSVPRGLPEDERVEELLRLLLGRSELDLRYHQGYTGTAIETFSSGKANCLAFTHLFVGMARELEVEAHYLRVDDLQSFEREGDLVVISGHVTAGFGSARQPRVLEFTVFPAGEYRQVRLLSDLSALALFYSNRGAELLLAGDRGGALEWLETAVAIDDSLSDAWVNLGVVRRRLGDLAGAERAYRQAIELDPELASAYQNLSALLIRWDGRSEEGERLLALTDLRGNRNPFNYLALGDLSLREGRLEDAQRYYRRALDLGPDEAEVQAAMGLWHLEAGHRSRARKWLKRALKTDPEQARVRRLAEQIAQG